MSSNFFIRKSKGGLKRKLSGKSVSKLKPSKSKKNDIKLKVNKAVCSDEISSDEESLKHHSEDESDEPLESAQDKKIKLAKKYLEEIENEEKERLEREDVQGSVVNRLKEDLLSQAGKLTKPVADFISKPADEDIFLLRCKEHKLPVTSIAISPDCKFIFSASKDATIVKWSIETKKKVGVVYSKHKERDKRLIEFAHNSTVLSLVISYDGNYLASCDQSSSGVIRIRNADTLEHIHSFKGHRSVVTSLAFCTESNNLYSCSKDRSVRVWNLDEMSFVETLFGHQVGVTDIDVLRKDRAVTSGGSDTTLRVWKIQEESQLIFNGHIKNIDRVSRLDQQHFLSCGDDGQICVWGILKKKPLSVLSNAHGHDDTNNEPNWITSVTCLPNSDLIVSGSCDGYLRFWKCGENFRNVFPLFSVPLVGFINAIKFSKDEKFLVVAVGKEHRLGRWYTEKDAKNSVVVLRLKITSTQSNNLRNKQKD